MSQDSETLPFTATTSSGEVLEFELPLHPKTVSPEHVGHVLEGVLDKLTEIIEGGQEISDGDVIQGLTLAVAIRLSVAGIPVEAARQLVEELANLAMDGFEGGHWLEGSRLRH